MVMIFLVYLVPNIKLHQTGPLYSSSNFENVFFEGAIFENIFFFEGEIFVSTKLAVDWDE